MARRSVASRAVQHVESGCVEVAQDLGGGERGCTCGRELDRERQPFEPAAQLRDCAGIARVELEPPVDGAGAGAVDRDGVLLGEHGGIVIAFVRDAQRIKRQHAFAPEPQWRLAGHEEAQAAAPLQEVGEYGRRREQMLEVVEEHEHLVALHAIGNRVDHVDVGEHGYPQRGGDLSDDELRPRRARERDGDAGRHAPLADDADDLEGEAGFADATAAGKGHQAYRRIAQRRDQLRLLDGPAEHRRRVAQVEGRDPRIRSQGNGVNSRDALPHRNPRDPIPIGQLPDALG